MKAPAVALVGFMASGKTTLGRRLAEELRREFVDLDQRVEAEAGMSISAIFERSGEAEFRRLEAQLLHASLRPGIVVATGGGIVEDAANREFLQQQSTVLWIDPPFELIRRRLQLGGRTRPLLQRLGIDGLEELYARRGTLYAEVSACRIATAGKMSPGRVVREMILRLTELEGGGLEQNR